jgi:hypothetical protein
MANNNSNSNNAGGGKLSDIRQTTSDAVEMLRQLANPGVQESLDKARLMTITVKEIMETMKSPEWVQNMENMRRMMDDMNSSSMAMQNAVRELRESGVLDEAKSLFRSARKAADSFSSDASSSGGTGGQDLKETLAAIREMLGSIKGLADELKAAAAESRQSGTLGNVQEAAKSMSGAYATVKQGMT